MKKQSFAVFLFSLIGCSPGSTTTSFQTATWEATQNGKVFISKSEPTYLISAGVVCIESDEETAYLHPAHGPIRVFKPQKPPAPPGVSQ